MQIATIGDRIYLAVPDAHWTHYFKAWQKASLQAWGGAKPMPLPAGHCLFESNPTTEWDGKFTV